ncbi:MAG: Lrp/AsnC ligand binding domain-containing protein [candidate division Zixibacteria bacterium]|nr:Lrp/AsnC ligand binding domain-containing protein [candidate division Zixibacteria bacterium]
MAAGSYLLVRFENRQKLLEAIDLLKEFNQIKNWNAVDGFFSLVLKINDDVKPVIDALTKFDSSFNYSQCDLIKDGNKKIELSQELSSSFLFIEAGKDFKDAITDSLEKMDSIAYTDKTEGSYDIVAIVNGENFDQIDRVIEEKIKPLDGILRFKQDRIIALDKM